MVEYEEEYFTKTGYQDGYRDYLAHAFRAKKIVEMSNPRNVLDVGCAYGYIVKYLVDMGVDAYGTDISEWCEKQAATIIPGRFKHGSADAIPWPDNSFDVLYCEGVLEHIEDGKIDKVMAEFGRVALRHIIAVSFPYHTNDSLGHVSLHDEHWWYQKIPLRTWLFLGNTGTEADCKWLFKG